MKTELCETYKAQMNSVFLIGVCISQSDRVLSMSISFVLYNHRMFNRAHVDATNAQPLSKARA